MSAPAQIPTKAIIGKGTMLSYKTLDASGSPTGSDNYVAELSDIDLPETTVGGVEATHYNSPNSKTEKLSVVWQDVSDLTFTLNYTKAQAAICHGIIGVMEQWTIWLPDGSTYVYKGWLSKLGGGKIPNKDVIKQPGTFIVNGGVTFTAGADAGTGTGA